jgi:hypothetical protein
MSRSAFASRLDAPTNVPVTGHRSQFNDALRHIEKVVTDGPRPEARSTERRNRP